MKKIFIGGSRHISFLGERIQQRLNYVIKNNFKVLIGDANGTDKAVQFYFSKNNYRNVEIFCAGSRCRNNIGNWLIRYIQVKRKTKDYRFYMERDKKLAEEADFGFMVWDTKSSGTFANVVELLKNEKEVFVEIMPVKKYIKLSRFKDCEMLLELCAEKTRKILQKKLNAHFKLLSKDIAPLQLTLLSSQ